MQEQEEQIKVATPPTDQKRKVGRPLDTEGIDKEVILKLALQEFATFGFDGTSISAIARKAGVKDSLLHYHFGNKDQIWKAAISRAANVYHEESQKTARYFKGLDVRSMTRALLRQLVYFAAENIELYQVIYHEMMHQSVRTEWLTQHVIKPFTEKTEWLYRIWHQSNDEPLEVPVSTFVSLSYGMHATFFIMQYPMQRLFQIDVFHPDQVEAHADMLSDMIMRTIFEKHN